MMNVTGARASRKRQTRRALLEAALRLAQVRGLSAVSLREVTRAAGVVPASFYRHFPDMDDLGVALVHECFEPMRVALRAVRVGPANRGDMIRDSVRVLVEQVHEHADLLRYIARERYGGAPPVREAIHEQLQASADELARDLLTGDPEPAGRLAQWRPVDVRMLTRLLVNLMVMTAAALLEQSEPEVEVVETATAQLNLIVLGARHWLD